MLAMVHAFPVAIVYTCTMAIVHACTMATVHACTMAIVHACTMAIAQVSSPSAHIILAVGSGGSGGAKPLQVAGGFGGPQALQ